MSDPIKDIENAILNAVKELFPNHYEAVVPKIKVWIDHKKGVIVSNVGMILGKETNCREDIVAVMLAAKVRETKIFKDVRVTNWCKAGEKE